MKTIKELKQEAKRRKVKRMLEGGGRGTLSANKLPIILFALSVIISMLFTGMIARIIVVALMVIAIVSVIRNN